MPSWAHSVYFHTFPLYVLLLKLICTLMKFFHHARFALEIDNLCVPSIPWPGEGRATQTFPTSEEMTVSNSSTIPFMIHLVKLL